MPLDIFYLIQISIFLLQMIIYSYDCAIKNLGFCCIEIDDLWKDKISVQIEEIKKIRETSNISKKVFIKKADTALQNILKILNGSFKLIYVNTFNLIKDKKVKEVKYTDIAKKLKYLLHSIDAQLPTPNYILIENQMSPNDKARGILRYLEDHYLPLEKPEDEIQFAIKDYPLNFIDVPDAKNAVRKNIVCINPNLKNCYSIDKSDNGKYSYYIRKYSNYTANKKHTTHNFKYYMEKTGNSKKIKTKTKLDDAADAFMMAYSWAVYEEYIIDGALS